MLPSIERMMLTLEWLGGGGECDRHALMMCRWSSESAWGGALTRSSKSAQGGKCWRSGSHCISGQNLTNNRKWFYICNCCVIPNFVSYLRLRWGERGRVGHTSERGRVGHTSERGRAGHTSERGRAGHTSRGRRLGTPVREGELATPVREGELATPVRERERERVGHTSKRGRVGHTSRGRSASTSMRRWGAHNRGRGRWRFADMSEIMLYMIIKMLHTFFLICSSSVTQTHTSVTGSRLNFKVYWSKFVKRWLPLRFGIGSRR